MLLLLLLIDSRLPRRASQPPQLPKPPALLAARAGPRVGGTLEPTRTLSKAFIARRQLWNGTCNHAPGCSSTNLHGLASFIAAPPSINDVLGAAVSRLDRYDCRGSKARTVLVEGGSTGTRAGTGRCAVFQFQHQQQAREQPRTCFLGRSLSSTPWTDGRCRRRDTFCPSSQRARDLPDNMCCMCTDHTTPRLSCMCSAHRCSAVMPLLPRSSSC